MSTLVNWSRNCTFASIHAVATPSSVAELQRIVAAAAPRLCVVGRGLSPNGLAFGSTPSDRPISLTNMSRILAFDDSRRRVRVESGIKLRALVDALDARGWTLPNLTSIDEQFVVGMMHSGSHGSGIGIAGSEDWQCALELVDATGTLHQFSPALNARQFDLARLSLGLLGPLTAVEVQCVESVPLLESVNVVSRAELARQHTKRLHQSRHVRYLYMPYSDHVHITTIHPVGQKSPAATSDADLSARRTKSLAALRQLYRRVVRGDPPADSLSAQALRVAVLATDPTNVELVRQVNDAEALSWEAMDGTTRIGRASDLLLMDCGGDQLVSEACHVASTANDEHADLSHVGDLLSLAEKSHLPLPGPVEQRWTAASNALLSAAGKHRVPSNARAAVFSWIGTMMYLPSPDSKQAPMRAAVEAANRRWREMWSNELWRHYDCAEHWAKIVPPTNASEAASLRQRLWRQFPLDEFCELRKQLDRSRKFGNAWLNELF
jgi:L-galactono-1,4-lactone dehydrogenase